MTPCTCGSIREFDDCCGPIIGGALPGTAEELLRSRYTAFALGNTDYLVDTLTPDIRDTFDQIEAESTAAGADWQSLEVRTVTGGGVDDETGSIEFVATFRLHGQNRIHHELSQFRREEGRWMCAGGQTNPKPPPVQVAKVGRNDPCPCGSGKKFKKCCGA
jgi:SEC-C motif domain protein